MNGDDKVNRKGLLDKCSTLYPEKYSDAKYANYFCPEKNKFNMSAGYINYSSNRFYFQVVKYCIGKN